jgi:hypothetical protein
VLDRPGADADVPGARAQEALDDGREGGGVVEDALHLVTGGLVEGAHHRDVGERRQQAGDQVGGAAAPALVRRHDEDHAPDDRFRKSPDASDLQEKTFIDDR